jgi:hypothetical protein
LCIYASRNGREESPERVILRLLTDISLCGQDAKNFLNLKKKPDLL